MSARLPRPACALALILLLSPKSLSAQAGTVCATGESLGNCFRRYVLLDTDAQAALATARDQNREEERDLRAKSAGPDLGGAAVASAIRDFLPRFAVSLLAPGPTDDPTALGLKYNLPLNDGVLFDLGLTARLELLANQAELFAPLVDSIPEAGREASRSRLKEQLEPYDDLTLGGALNVENRSWGRSFRPHQDSVQALARQILSFATPRDPVSGLNEREAAVNAIQRLVTRRLGEREIAASRAGDAACQLQAQARWDLPFDCLSAEARDTVETYLGRAARAEARWRQEAERRIREYGFNRISELINNQRQVNFSGSYRARRDIVGPDEWTGTARLEFGFANMNGLRSFCRRAGTGLQPGCLKDYVTSPSVRSSLARGDRVWTEFAVNHRPAYAVSLKDEGVGLSLGAATTLALSGGYGAYFGNPSDGANRDRFDLQGKYDFARDDALRQDRFVATAFYTRHLSDQSSAVLGLTWANRPEFVGDVDRKLGANLGFTYKLHQPESAAAPSGAAAAAGGTGGTR